VKVWRLPKTRFAATAFDGEGARLNAGRWNSVGTRLVYTSESIALATLEVLVHLGNAAVLPSYSTITATIPDDLIEDLDFSILPGQWNTFPAPPEVQAIGDVWIQSGRSLALRVPSAIVADSSNVLVNPQHKDFHRVKIDPPARFDFDPRLLR